jgi:uncharacterized protein
MYGIQNLTKGTKLSSNSKWAASFLDKLFGLHLTQNPRTLIFKTRWGIHTFGLAYPIDVVVLDAKCMIVAMKKSLNPNRVYFWNPRYQTVIELPIDTLNKSNSDIGDFLELK